VTADAQSEADDLVVLYTVQPGDAREGLAGLARRLYGDAARWITLYEANRGVVGNNPAVIRPGQSLVVAGLGAAPAPGQARAYTVQPGDAREGLAGLARRLYGDAARWPELYAVNRAAVGDDPSRLQAGQRLVVLCPPE
jgi:nucleoid-associated protein YgaU